MELKFTGPDIMTIANDMALFLTQFGFAITGYGETTESIAQEVEDEEILGKAAEPVREPDPEPVPEEEPEKENETNISPADAKQKAIDLLMAAYNDGKAKEVKELLGAFGVKKFGELPEDKGHELLAAAEEL